MRKDRRKLPGIAFTSPLIFSPSSRRVRREGGKRRRQDEKRRYKLGNKSSSARQPNVTADEMRGRDVGEQREEEEGSERNRVCLMRWRSERELTVEHLEDCKVHVEPDCGSRLVRGGGVVMLGESMGAYWSAELVISSLQLHTAISIPIGNS